MYFILMYVIEMGHGFMIFPMYFRSFKEFNGERILSLGPFIHEISDINCNNPDLMAPMDKRRVL